MVRTTVESGASPAASKGKESCSTRAVRTGSTKIVKFLLKNGADANAGYDTTPAGVLKAYANYEEALVSLVPACELHPGNTAIRSALVKHSADIAVLALLKPYSTHYGNIAHLLVNYAPQNTDTMAAVKLLTNYRPAILHGYSFIFEGFVSTKLLFSRSSKANIMTLTMFTTLQLACLGIKSKSAREDDELGALVAALCDLDSCIYMPLGEGVARRRGGDISSDVFLELCDGDKDGSICYNCFWVKALK
jgi:hypothetical protein